MNTYQLTGQTRTEFGKTQVKKYRKENLVPAVIYYQGKAVHFTVPQGDVRNLIYTPETFLISIDIDGKNTTAILQSAQFHHVHEFLEHLEFVQVDADQIIQVTLPVKLIGTAEGALAGGKLVQKARKLKVRGFYKDLPDFIEVDVTALKLGRSLKVRDIEIEGVVIASPADLPIATVEITRQLRQEAGKK